jgi:predicted amidohydrolase YtcJ
MTTSDQEIVLITGRVLTQDAADTVCDGLAIRSDRVVALGTVGEMRARSKSGTRLIEMPGATVIPGFNDVHAHMEREGLKLIRPSLASCGSIADIQMIVRREAADRPPGAWITTMPIGAPPHYFQGLASLAEGRPPNRFELDEAAPRNPVCIPGVFANWGMPPGYTCLNSIALSLNGITAATRSSIDGITIEKDESGEPTGVIIETNQRPRVDYELLKAVPRFTEIERCNGICASMKLYNAVGTTSVYEGHGSSAQIIGLYRSLWAAGKLTVRVGLVVSPPWADIKEARWAMQEWLAYSRDSGIGDDWLRISGIHVTFGGSPDVKKFALNDLPNTGWAGFVEQAHDVTEFEAVCNLAAENRLRVHVIVNDQLADVVAILERVHAVYNLQGRRWVVEHIARTNRSTLQRLASLGVLVTTIPVYYLWKNSHAYDLNRGNEVVPMRTMLDVGLDPAAGTDNIPHNPGFTLWAMCERLRRSDGAVLGPDERLTRRQALRSMTVAGAQFTFDETRKGPLAPGFLADIAVLNDDPLTASADALRQLRSELTIVGGRVVHGALQ